MSPLDCQVVDINGAIMAPKLWQLFNKFSFIQKMLPT
jgi:hypothetical protein